jgi:hypothetical protein
MVVLPPANIVGGNLMRAKMFPLLTFVALFGAILISNSCGSSKNCPVCGTDTHGTVGLIDVMIVPEHNPNGEPGGPFNIFDIGWVDPVNRLYSITDRIGLDVPVFSTTTNIALFAIGGQNSVAEAGNNASPCWFDTELGTTATIPPITSAQGNYTRFGCKTDGFRLPGGFGPNGLFGGFIGGQCCASRANNLNPLTGPNGLEVSADGNFMFVGNGSASFVVFDLAPMLTSGFTLPPQVTAVIPTGTSPDYDGLPNGITNCEQSANGRAFADPTCGDLRGDELATTGSVVTFPQDGSSRFLVAIINGDPGLPFVSIVDVTGVVTRTGTDAQQHCLAYSQVADPTVQAPFSPGISTYIQGPGGPTITTTFPANYSTCILGQIFYDQAAQNDITTFIDDGGPSPFPCPDPSLQFAGPTPGSAGAAVPAGASGHAAGFNPDIPCHHGPQLTVTTPTQPGGVFCPPGPGTPPGCIGSFAPAGLGGLLFYPPLNAFFVTNGNSTPDITVGSVDVIDPLHPIAVGEGGTAFVPAVINSYPIPMCMPTSLNLGPGTDVLVGCADHDGRAFAPSTVIIDGTTGQILTTINNVGFVDETWFNPGDNKYYLAARDMPSGPVLGVIDAKSRQWLQNVPTNGNAHSVAVDPINNHIYVPLPSGSAANCQSVQADGCVGVYASQ